MPVSQRITVPQFRAARDENRRLAVLTAYDYASAALLDAAGVDALLVGDSLAMVVQGRDTTLGVTLEQMIYHAAMVVRGSKRALVIGDLPFGSYHTSMEQGIASSVRFMQEAGVSAVKLEGGADKAPLIEKIVSAGIPVMAHCGLLPQHVHALGGFKLVRDAARVMTDCLAVEKAGAFAVVLECVPDSLAKEVTEALAIPTIGIGAGPHCSGQVLVSHDMLGLTQGYQPKFAKRFAQLGKATTEAAAAYVNEVHTGAFPPPRSEQP